MTTPRTPEGVIAAALNQVFVNQRQQVMTSAANVVDAIMRALTLNGYEVRDTLDATELADE